MKPSITRWDFESKRGEKCPCIPELQSLREAVHSMVLLRTRPVLKPGSLSKHPVALGINSTVVTVMTGTGRPLLCLSTRYDSLTGVPSCQRTLAFEKGSVLFNIGALYTQMGARQDRSAAAGIDRAIDAFQRAAGAGNYQTTKHIDCAMSQHLLYGTASLLQVLSITSRRTSPTLPAWT